MPTSPGVKSAVAPAWQDVAIVWGTELLLVGGLAAAVAWRAGPGVIVAVGAAIGATLGGLAVALERSVWRPTANAILAAFLSFASIPPGIFFFVELLSRRDGACYERPWFSAGGAWVLLGPTLVIVSAVAAPWRRSSFSLLVIRALHVVAWLVGAGNTMLCAMTV
jgi:hypothetical protein